MSSEKIKKQANNALTELEEAVYQTVLNYNYVQLVLLLKIFVMS